MGVWVEGFLVPFVCGISEHETLISSSEIIHILLSVDCGSDFLALSLDVDENASALVVKTLAVIIITDLLADFSCDLLVVDCTSIDESLSEEADQLGLGGGLNTDLAVGVDGEAGVEDGV